MDWKSMLLQGSSVIVPLMWSQVGPLAIRTITQLVNAFSQQYVPREWQVVLSAVLGAIMAGLAGDPPAVMGLGAVAGIVSQKLAGADPKWMKTSAPE